MIRGVLFDFDETLVDSLETFWHAFNRGVTRVGLPPATLADVAAGLSRVTELRNMVVQIYPEADADTVDASLRAMRGQLAEVVPDHPITLKPDAAEVLAGLKARGFKLGLVTARTATGEAMWAELADFGIADYFDCLATGRELPRKPAPDGILNCLAQLEMSPDEVILVGDAEADIIAGAAAGVEVVLVSDGDHDQLKHPPDHGCRVILGLKEIFDFLERRDSC